MQKYKKLQPQTTCTDIFLTDKLPLPFIQESGSIYWQSLFYSAYSYYSNYLSLLLHRLNHRHDVGRVDRAVTVDVGGDIPGFNGYGFGRVSGFIDDGALSPGRRRG